MKKQQTLKTASGSALVIALLILLAMTIVGVATLASVNMQERMAGNANLQSLAFESASAGLSEALSWAFNPADKPDGDKRLRWHDCERGNQEVWRVARDQISEASDPNPLLLSTDTDQTVSLQYVLRNDCIPDPIYDAVVAVDPTFEPPVSFFVTSEGTVFAEDGTPLARREIEVQIVNIRGDGLSAIRIEGQAEVNFDAANSDSFVVDGGGGPAISTSSLGNASMITTDIVDKDRIGNYEGGIVQSPYPPPFNTADKLARLALLIKGYMRYVDVPASNFDVTKHCTGTPPLDRAGTPHPTMRFVDGDLSIGNGRVDGITYVTGNFTALGNASGSGLLIVEGTIDTRGTPDFDGLIIALGGLVDMSGGGKGVTNGMVFATNLPLEDSGVNEEYRNRIAPYLDGDGKWGAGGTWLDGGSVPAFFQEIGGDLDGSGVLDYKGLLGIDGSNDGFGPTTMTFAGGGNHSFNYDCGKVESIRDFLATCTAENGQPALLVEDWQSFGCEVPGRGAAIAAMRSWRENLGWRELLR